MTVKELIGQLNNYPEDAYVGFHTDICQLEINKSRDFSYKNFVGYINIEIVGE